ncbi:MAG: tetratricopeptide repeat protein [Bacteroidetes bacterium]|jgi:serine/threonine-protein kinase|nr:tetratricopeptide repeat protein [Bacteroidota bacterium]
MKPARWKKISTLFKEIADLNPVLRAERLKTVKSENPAIYEELITLLKADSDQTSLLDGFAADHVDFTSLFPLEGVQVGPFLIEKLIGSGGMGNVYLANRTEGGFEQTVALKLIKYGMGSEQAVNRFLGERSILARLQHPNIARLIDGGITAEERPWFAMEYVKGNNILDYSKEKHIQVEERLQLFLDVIDAVRYAHKNLIVHRDLKPDNIMVTGDENTPMIKLLDFGIAKILEESEPKQFEFRAMTRAYASPEQKSGESTSTASDIYSLGVILAELLTGCHPNEEFRKENCSPSPVSKELRAVINKAMQDDPAERFEHVSGLSDEIRNWMAQRPVGTYSKKPLYRFIKWINRNRVGSFIGLFSIVSITILILVYTNELKNETQRAQNEARRATRIASVLGSSLRSIDPMQNRGEELSALGMVDMSTAYINNELVDDPRTRSELLITMANIYANLIKYDKADTISSEAVELYQQFGDTTSFTYIDMLADRSIILDKAGKYGEGLAMIRHAIELTNQHLEPGSLEFASVHLDYSYHLDVNQEYAMADSVLMLIQPIYEQNREEAGESYDDFIFYLGTNYRRTGEYEKAEEYLFRSLERSRARYPGIHEQIASTLNHISSLYQNMGEYDKALPYAIEAHDMRLEIFGPGHLNTIAAHSNTARAYSGAGRLQEAAETYRDVLAIFRDEYGNENFYIAGILQSYGNVHLKMEDYTRAEEIIRESLEHSERLLPADHIRQAYPLKGLADALRGQNRFEEALPYAERAFVLRNQQLPADNANLMSSRFTLGLCLWNLDRRDEAEPHLREALAFFRTNPGKYANQIGKIEELNL